jgi:citrate lyase subunit beta-like protein
VQQRSPLTLSPVPACTPEFLEKSVSLKADTIIFDLEDSVLPKQKAAAASALRKHLVANGHKYVAQELAVRINHHSDPQMSKDIRLLGDIPKITTVVVPKVESGQQIQSVVQALDHAANGRIEHKVLALIESARGVTELGNICGSSSRLKGLIFGAEDYAADMELPSCNVDTAQMMSARMAVVRQARAHKLESIIDSVHPTLVRKVGEKPNSKNPGQFAQQCHEGALLGFTGKQCIHPSQLPSANEAFSPSMDQVTKAVRIELSNRRLKAGTFMLDGRMVDAPVVRRAQAVLRRATAAGLPVGKMMQAQRDKMLDSASASKQGEGHDRSPRARLRTFQWKLAQVEEMLTAAQQKLLITGQSLEAQEGDTHLQARIKSLEQEFERLKPLIESTRHAVAQEQEKQAVEDQITEEAVEEQAAEQQTPMETTEAAAERYVPEQTGEAAPQGQEPKAPS